MPIVCPYCSHAFGGEKISPRHIAKCPKWPRTLTEPCLCGFRAESDNKLKAHKKTCEAWQARDKKAVRRERLVKTNLERFGAASPIENPEIRARIAATNRERYGAENPFAREASTFDAVQASLEGKRPILRGAENPFAREDVKAKIRESMLERHGVANPQQSPEIRARTTATSEERYGGVLLSSPVLAEKARETNLALYGDVIPQRTEAVKAKQRETNMSRYGVPWTSMDPEIRAKQLEAHHAKWGSHYFASEEGKAHIRSVLVERFGVGFPGAIEGHWDKAVETFKERYGVEHPLQLAEFLSKQRDTTLAKYGVENVMQNGEVRERAKETNNERYGSPFFVGSASYKEWSRGLYGTDHPMQNREYARQHFEKMSPSIGGPNGLERKVIALAPQESIFFTGDFSFWRWLPKLGHHKNPDFIVPGPDPDHPKKGVTKVVEAFGDFYHSRIFTGKAPFEHEQELIDAYAEIGIECLILWESEVNNDSESVRARLDAFLGEVDGVHPKTR